MMKSKVFSGLLFIIIPGIIMGQNLLKGEIYVSDSLFLEEVVEIYEKELGYLGSTNLGGKFEISFDNSSPKIELRLTLSSTLLNKLLSISMALFSKFKLFDD